MDARYEREAMKQEPKGREEKVELINRARKLLHNSVWDTYDIEFTEEDCEKLGLLDEPDMDEFEAKRKCLRNYVHNRFESWSANDLSNSLKQYRIMRGLDKEENNESETH